LQEGLQGDDLRPGTYTGPRQRHVYLFAGQSDIANIIPVIRPLVKVEPFRATRPQIENGL
jgi:hypothetical protein